MSVGLDLSRNAYITAIGNEEIEQITRATIEHFAITFIDGVSMDEVSQQEYEEMGGSGTKPNPLSPEAKFELYARVKIFFKEKIVKEAAKLVNSVLEESLATLSDDELRLRVAALNEKVVEAEPNLKKLPDLFNDHVCLFKDLQKSTYLKADLISFHDKLCPIIERYRDSDELYDRIKMDEFLSLYDHS